jgi:tetratricopeptide (TPR) repeat protein
MTKQELSTKLKIAVSNNQFNEGKQVFLDLFNQFQNELNEWDVFYALKIQKAGIEIENIDQVIEKFYDFGPVKNMYVLVLKEKYIDTLDQNNFRNHEKWIEKITQISVQKNFNQENVDSYPCNYTRGVLKMLKFYRKPNLNVEKVTFWISKLDPSKLSREEFKFKDSEGKERILASPLEDYYSILSDLKLKERKYEECIQICENALGLFSKFHYDNDIWFKRRIALSHIELGKQDLGFDILLNLTNNRKGEKWFIFHEIANLYFEKGEYEKALEFNIKAIALPRDEDKKISVYLDTARSLFKLNRLEDSKLMAEFISIVATKENLKLKSEVLNLLEYFKINSNTNQDVKSAFFSTKKRILELFGVNNESEKRKLQLKKVGNDSTSNLNRYQGNIAKILHDNDKGKDGFIKSKIGQHYFTLSSKFHLTSQITLGTLVEFQIITRDSERKEQIKILKIIKNEN